MQLAIGAIPLIPGGVPGMHSKLEFARKLLGDLIPGEKGIS